MIWVRWAICCKATESLVISGRGDTPAVIGLWGGGTFSPLWNICQITQSIRGNCIIIGKNWQKSTIAVDNLWILPRYCASLPKLSSKTGCS